MMFSIACTSKLCDLWKLLNFNTQPHPQTLQNPSVCFLSFFQHSQLPSPTHLQFATSKLGAKTICTLYVFHAAVT